MLLQYDLALVEVVVLTGSVGPVEASKESD